MKMAKPSDNKRIAKNTLYLFFRMIILLVVGLYTSRVMLLALGVSDYGIYNVVGGIVVMFVFINYAMVNSTQRYITYELGRGDKERLSLIFSTSINIHAIIALIIVAFSETIGLWFFYNKMVIPADRTFAAFWIFQFSVLATIVGVMSVPYNALIIAHERMSAFAYISFVDAFLKLLIVILLLYLDTDKLVLYGALILLINIVDRVIYGVYCKKYFTESRYHFALNKSLMIEMSKFASWNLLGNFSYVCYTQGLNLLLNVFFNPVVNAARGIAVQVQSVVSNFSYNIENAIKPQITKSYAQNNLDRMHTLIFISSRMSFFTLLFISLPILLETKQVLSLWLVEVPDHTVNFVRLTIFILMTDSLTNPLLTASQATGDMKKYQLTVSLLCFLILPFSYIALLLVPIPEIVFLISLVIGILSQFVKLLIVGHQINLSIHSYFQNVFRKAFEVTALSCLLTFPVLFYVEETIGRLIFLLFYCLGIVSLTVYIIGINCEERQFVKNKIVQIAFQIRKR